MENLRYTVFLIPAVEGGFTATVPALPAIVTEGDTRDEALQMAHEAIERYIESLQERGLSIPVEEPSMLPKYVEVEVARPGAA